MQSGNRISVFLDFGGGDPFENVAAQLGGTIQENLVEFGAVYLPGAAFTPTFEFSGSWSIVNDLTGVEEVEIPKIVGGAPFVGRSNFDRETRAFYGVPYAHLINDPAHGGQEAFANVFAGK